MSAQTSEFGPLVEAPWLAANLALPGLRVIDFRWDLAEGSRHDLYVAGHIPGAVFVGLDDVTGHDGPGRHPLPDAAQFTEVMRSAGVDEGAPVVVYDASGGFSAARLWWLLRHHGHRSVAVLDGGLAAWSGALEQGEVVPARGDFRPRAPVTGPVLDHAQAARVAAEGVLIDARVAERYRGDFEPVDPRAGHVPGAVNIPWRANLDDRMRFRAPGALRADYEAVGVAPGVPVAVYCGSGVTACLDLLAMTVAGLEPAALYEGSWSDWAVRPGLPVATGDSPA